MMTFQIPDAELTLEEGLAEYYASRNDLVGGRGISSDAREFFRCHDAAHVVFGCSTTLLDEAVVKIWSFFGTTAGLCLVRKYRLPEAKEVYGQLRWATIARTTIQSLVIVPRTLSRCIRMRKRWPWSDFDCYRKVSLSELRREFGIEPLATE